MKNNKTNKKTVLLALSGGVDSSVAAILLKKQGYRVIAAFMKCFSDTKNPITEECNWIEERKMAQKVAAKLKIPFITLDLEKEYKKQVLDPMYKAYKKGLTPNPDIACNTIIKFPLLWKAAEKYKADYIATGHYANIKKTNKGYQLLAGKDKNKDQSYFLYELGQKDLEHTLLPISSLTKNQVRAIAKKNKLPNWNKLGTRGICFVGKINMKNFLEKKIKKKIGKVLDPNKIELGTHQGSMYYTIGQRVGPHIGINIDKSKGEEQERWYVAKKLKNNIIIVAPEDHELLKTKAIKIKNLHLVNPNEKIPASLLGRIRHLGDLHPGTLVKTQGKYIFKLKKSMESVAPGQSLVLYSKNQLIGGGEIISTD